MSLKTTKAHWENVYQTKGPSQVSWHQEEPTLSLALIESVSSDARDIVDIGGGSSLLACRLATKGFNMTVVDISATAMARAQDHCGEAANRIRWVVADVTASPALGTTDIWHDRAVFHFLTSPEDRAAYVSLLKTALRPGGHLVIGTFALDGPSKCSGLPVQRYDAAGLAQELGDTFCLLEQQRETHQTPAGKTQSFQYVLMRRETS